MNRTHYYNYVEEKLGVLAYRINLKGKLNILDLHLHSENFYLHFLNKLYGWNFTNANPIKQNVEAIDLIDHTNKCICPSVRYEYKTEGRIRFGKTDNCKISTLHF